tara:strand:+ start:743 stop:1066 length:324 start_codon:yes stop_codon:yes gene_type:complete
VGVEVGAGVGGPGVGVAVGVGAGVGVGGIGVDVGVEGTGLFVGTAWAVASIARSSVSLAWTVASTSSVVEGVGCCAPPHATVQSMSIKQGNASAMISFISSLPWWSY